jgi:hypothetical protein
MYKIVPSFGFLDTETPGAQKQRYRADERDDSHPRRVQENSAV